MLQCFTDFPFSAKMTVIVCSNDEIVNKILENVSKSLRVIITIREIRRSTLEKAAFMGIQVKA